MKRTTQKNLMALIILLGFLLNLNVRGEAISEATTKELWKEHCASCHGMDGKGKTKAGRKARVEDLTDAKYQEKFNDEEAFKQIKEGMKKDGREAMKAFGDKLNDNEIEALVAYLRKFKK